MDKSKALSIAASAYNLHVQQGEGMTPAKVDAMPRGDKAALCLLLETKGGSDLYTQDDAKSAYAFFVS